MTEFSLPESLTDSLLRSSRIGITVTPLKPNVLCVGVKGPKFTVFCVNSNMYDSREQIIDDLFARETQ